MTCHITRTGSFLPGPPIGNDAIQDYLGTVEGEEKVRRQVLAANGILARHYAQNRDQTATHDVYQLAVQAVQRCLDGAAVMPPITYLAAGSTYTPLAAPGISSILHGALAEHATAAAPIEVNSNAGICTSAATAFINAYRAIQTGDHDTALCVGTEHASEILKSSVIRPPRDMDMMQQDLKQSNWFMSVFLRFMLSDGAGAWLLRNQPAAGDAMSLAVDWVFARSFAHEAPLCMQLDSRTALLRQDVRILSKYLFPCADKFVAQALARHNETLDAYRVILPHISSYYFRRKMERLIRKFTRDADRTIDYWTNLATAGNTGAASIFIMLDEYVRTHQLHAGDRLLLFVPESGRFNFVLISLTVVRGDHPDA